MDQNRRWYGFRSISVEPTLGFYMLAFMTTTVVEQDFFVQKACRVNHGYNASVCGKLNSFPNAKHQVQITVSNFLQWNEIATYLMPIIIVLFMGSWSDRHGRKLPLILGLFGKLYYSSMIIILNLNTTWPLQYVTYFATLPMALTGADVLIFSSAYSYLTDITTIENRTFRITILDASYLSTMPLGILFGRYLFSNVTNRSYTILFGINVAFMIISITYSLLMLQWRTNEKQKPLKELKRGFFADIFDGGKPLLSYKYFTRDRIKDGQIYLLPFLIVTALSRFQREERNYTFLYFLNAMDWSYNEYSDYRTIQSFLYVLVMLFGVKMLKFRDTVLILLACSSHIVSRLICIFSHQNWLFYLAAVVGSLGPISGPVLRSLVSKLIAPTERGKVFSIISAADNSVPMLSGVLYTQIYNATVKSNPASFWWLTIATQIFVFGIICFYQINFKKDELIYKTKPQGNALLPNVDTTIIQSSNVDKVTCDQ